MIGHRNSIADDQPFDPGLQVERTFLSWQRTVLALVVACAVATRYTAENFGVVAVLAGMVGLGLAIAGYVGVMYRYRRVHSALRQSATLMVVSAWPLAALTAATVMLGVLAVLFLAGGSGT